MSSTFQLNYGDKNISLGGFDKAQLKALFDLYITFLDDRQGGHTRDSAPTERTDTKPIPPSQTMAPTDLGGSPSIASLNRPVGAGIAPSIIVDDPSANIPQMMDFDNLGRFMCQAFPENKIESNQANSRVLRNLFITFLKLTQFNIRELQKTRYIIDIIKTRPYVAQKTCLSAVSKAYQMYKLSTPPEIIERMHELTGEIEGQMKTRIMSEKERKVMISKSEVDNLLEKYKDSIDLSGKQYYLMLLLYTQMEPLRMDYVDMLVGKDSMSETENYCNYHTGHIFLRKYKTASTYGDKVISLKKSIQDYITDLIKWRKENNITSPYLFLSPKTLTTMSKPSFCKSLNHIFGKTVSVNILRKFYVSTHIDASQLEKEEKMATNMLHSSKVQKLVYCKHLENTDVV